MSGCPLAPPGGAEPCLSLMSGVMEPKSRSTLHPHRLRTCWANHPGGLAWSCSRAGWRHRRAGRALRADGAGSQAAARPTAPSENIGIIYIGLGPRAPVRANGVSAGAALSANCRAAACPSTTRSSKACCFFARALCWRDRRTRHGAPGRLIHGMPVTAFAFLAGSIAISALPPFNGFVSEWLEFQAHPAQPRLATSLSWGPVLNPVGFTRNSKSSCTFTPRKY